MADTSLGHLPSGEKWEFDAGVAACFDDMLARSIPEYRSMRDLVRRVAKRYARPWSGIVDLGASRGEAIAELVTDPEVPESTYFQAWEVAPAMLAELRKRWPQLPPDEKVLPCDPRLRVRVVEADLRKPFDAGSASVVLSVLTLQFTPIEHRLRIIRDVWKSLLPGGAFVLVEKVLGNTADLNELLVDEYYAEKRANGYTQDEIDRKRASLEGVLVPVTARWNEDLLRGAGFHDVDCFWRHLNFAGWVAVK